MFTVKAKIMECSINSRALALLMKHLVIGQRLKTPNFSAFHWSPRGSLVPIGQQFVATRVVHLPKNTETSLITESDQRGPKHQILQLCTTSTAWSDSDQEAVRACIAVIAGFYHLSNSCTLFFYLLYICFYHVNKFVKSKVGIFRCQLK